MQQHGDSMPQTSEYLANKWTEESAYNALVKNFKVINGWIKQKKDIKIDSEEWEAIQYLIEEWDYAYGDPLYETKICTVY